MHLSDVSPPMAGLISSLIASVLYGLNIVAFFTCLYVLLRRRAGGRKVPWFIFWVAIAQFIVSTIHIGSCWRQAIEAFIWNGEIPGGSFAYFIKNLSKPTVILSDTLVFVESFLTDSVLTWRLYVVWNKNIFVCIFPITTMLAYIATFIITLVKLSQLSPVDTDLSVILQWSAASMGLTLTTHVVLTSLIVGKIWRVTWNRQTYVGESRHTAVAWMMLESGAIYSVLVLFYVIFAALKTQVGGIISNIFIQLCELIPTLIIVRVCLGLTSDLTTRNRDDPATTIEFHRVTNLSVHETIVLKGGHGEHKQKGVTEC